MAKSRLAIPHFWQMLGGRLLGQSCMDEEGTKQHPAAPTAHAIDGEVIGEPPMNQPRP